MRRAGAAKREVLPDPKYGSRLVANAVTRVSMSDAIKPAS